MKLTREILFSRSLGAGSDFIWPFTRVHGTGNFAINSLHFYPLPELFLNEFIICLFEYYIHKCQ